jgi:nitroreductase
MNFDELILKRQSDRKYLPDAVAKEDILKCLEAARMSPSACNSQPWKFIVVDDRAKLVEMADAAEGLGMNGFAHGVPVMVAVVREKMNFSARMGSLFKRKDYSMLDLGMAVENFCLQAADLGLGTCIMGWFDERRIARLLGVHRRKRIPLIIALGHPDGRTRRKARKAIDEMSSWNSY